MNRYRWVVLLAFIGVVAVSQMLWLNFAPLTDAVVQRYRVGQLQAGMLTLVFPVIYVFLSIPSGFCIDRFGYARVVGISSIIMALAAGIRLLENSFAVLMTGQLIVALAQPFILNSISKLVSDWFDEHQAALATGLGTVGIFTGMVIGMGLSPWLSEQYGFSVMLQIFLIIAVIAVLIFLLFGRENPDNAGTANPTITFADFWQLCHHPQLLLLLLSSFLALGVFNTLLTWLQPILEPRGINADQAGMLGGLLIIAGVFGSMIIPAISDSLGRRKAPLVVACGAAVALFYPFISADSLNGLMILGCLLGFLFLPGYALLLTMTEEWAGRAKAGIAASMVMLMGNAGGALFSVAAQELTVATGSWQAANLSMLGLLVITWLLAFFLLRETFTLGYQRQLQKGAHVMITGGSSGIGLALAGQMAVDGYDVTLIARGQDKLNAAVAELERRRSTEKQRFLAVAADVGNADSITTAVNQAIAELGPPTVMVTSAGIAVPGYFQDLPLSNFERTMQINFLGTVYALRAALPSMLDQGFGHLVVVSSGAALTGIFGYTSYGASKFALRGFSEALRCEMKPLGIHVSIVYPPDTDTPQLLEESKTKPYETKQMTGSAKVMTADQVAHCIYQGIQRRRFVVAPGAEIKMLVWINSIAAPLLYSYFDGIVAKARRVRER